MARGLFDSQPRLGHLRSVSRLSAVERAGAPRQPAAVTQREEIGMRKLCVVSLTVAALSGLCILHAQEKPNTGPPAGGTTTGTVTMLDPGPKPAIAHARFEPGARTKWHKHEAGQIILVEEGVAHTQVKGGPVIELRPGDMIYAAPGVWHWHGAAPDRGGVQFNVSRGETTWGDEVTDAEFRTAPGK